MDSIQLLTRKGATCSDLLSCLYNLKPIELDVLFVLGRNPMITLDAVSIAIERDRSTTHRILSKLVSASLAYKESKSLKDGGYYHVYSIVELDKIKKQSTSKVEEITESLRKMIDNFDVEFQKAIKTKSVTRT